MTFRQRGVRVGIVAGQLGLCAALLGGPCGGKDAPTGPVRILPAASDDVVVTVTSYNPRVGETVHIGAERVTRDKRPLSPPVACTFTGSSNVFANVGLTSGVIAALAPGTLLVTVQCGDLATTVTLNIRPALVTLSINMLGAGTGSVFASPAGLVYDAGTTVTLTARPLSVQPGASIFTGWGGACAAAGTNTQCVITLAANTTVTAAFAPAFVLRLLLAGSGEGGIVADSSQQTYAAGTTVRLTAVAYDGSGFAGWRDDCSGTAIVCNIVMNADRTATAYFERTVTLSTDFYGDFGQFSGNTNCTFSANLSGSLTARHFTKLDGTIGGTATARVDIGITTVVGSCTANSSSFTNTTSISGPPSALAWTNSGPQNFSMAFTGVLTNASRIDGRADAVRTFITTGASGTTQTVLRAQLPGMYLTP